MQQDISSQTKNNGNVPGKKELIGRHRMTLKKKTFNENCIALIFLNAHRNNYE